MSLLKGVDSFSAPTGAQLALAKADGVTVWNGYLPGKGIDSTWTSADFARIKEAGLHSIAYASGFADPQAMRGLANQWGVRGCLDVESGIRGDGPWVQPWLDDLGFGVYHEEYEFPRYSAPFHVMADYVGADPKDSWPANVQRPTGPVGWQWKANCVAYGAHVDLCWFDGEIFGVAPPPPPTPIPPVGEEIPVFIAQNAQEGDYLVFENGLSVPIGAITTVTDLQAALRIPVVNVDAEFIAGLKALVAAKS